MIDFKQKLADEDAAKIACNRWEEQQPCVMVQPETESFKIGFKEGLLHERKKWQKFKWRNGLEKPEPDSYVIVAEDMGNGEYDFIVGSFTNDSEPYISNGYHARMWHCIDRWCYVHELGSTIPSVRR